MIDFLKTLAERLRMELLLAALAIAILLFKIFDFDAWWMIFAFCVAYIALLGAESAIKGIANNREANKMQHARALEAKREADEHNEEVWKRFNVLDKQTLDFVRTIYLAEQDPSNNLIRYFHDGGSVSYEVDHNSAFRIPAGGRAYYLLLKAEYIGNSSVITFHPYYLKLVAHYVETGRKERVQ